MDALKRVEADTPSIVDAACETDLSKKFSRTLEGFFVNHRKKFSYLQAGMLLALLILMVVPAFLGLPPDGTAVVESFTLLARFLVWGLWFPLVFISIIAFGRIWCGVLCPQGALSEYVSRWGLGKTMPKWLQKGWVPILSFVVITVIGQVVGVRDYPLPAMVIFIGTTLLAVGVGLVFSRNKRVWCRHLCPVGPLLGIFARLGSVGFERNGRDGRGSICPTFIKTQTKVASSNCIECFKCVNPGSPGTLHLELRRPGKEIEEIEKKGPEIWEVIFLFAATGLALGAFHWQANPFYEQYRAVVGSFLLDLGILDFIGQSGPWWVMVNYPEAGEVFNYLDLITISTFMLVFMTAAVVVLAALTALSALLSKKDGPIIKTITKGGYIYAPVALVSLVLGLGQMLFESLGGLGIGAGETRAVEGIFFTGGALWSLYLAWKLHSGIRRINVRAFLPSASGVFTVAFLWQMVIF